MKRIFLAVLAAATLFASCSKENNNNEDTDAPGQSTKVRLTLTQNGTPSRAYVENESPVGTEGDVNTIDIYTFNNANNLLESHETFTAAEIDDMTFDSKTGLHTFFVAVNLPAGKAPTATVGSTPLKNFRDDLANVLTVTSVSDLHPSGSFLMTNLKEATFTLTTDEETNTLAIEIGRVLAKAEVKALPTDVEKLMIDGIHVGTLSDMKYAVGQMPTKMYLMPVAGTDGILRTPQHNIADPTSYLKLPVTTSVVLGASTYIMESSQVNSAKGATTILSIEGKFTPIKVCKADGTDGGVPMADGTFWVVMKGKTIVGSKFFAEEPTVTLNANEEIVKYEDGMVYYSTYLYDPNISHSIQKYFVHRNYSYHVTVNSITSLGNDTQFGDIDPDDDKPIDGYPTTIEISIVPKPWRGVDVPVNL